MRENISAERASKINKLTGLRDSSEDNFALFILGASDISKEVLEKEGFKFSGKAISLKGIYRIS
jgi:hypothetical protein